jgi:hypothetical protein
MSGNERAYLVMSQFRQVEGAFEGTRLVHSTYGTPVQGNRIDVGIAGAELRPATMVDPGTFDPKSLLPPSRDGFCRENDDTCKARQAKGTDYCIGHLRSREKAGT